MKQFTFSKDQISRLKTLNSYIKKLESICPLNNNQLFTINDNKLSIYGYGDGSLGAGFIEASYDIENTEPFYFVLELNRFIQLLEKTKSDSISISLNESSQLIFKGNNSDSKFSQVVMSLDADSVKEISSAITNYKTSIPYKSSIDFDVSDIKASLNSASSILGILNVNKFIKINNSGIFTADNVSVINIKTNNGISQDIYLHKNIPSLISEVNSFKICNLDNEYWIYIDIPTQGIQLYFAEPPIDYQTPSEKELDDMSPKNNYVIVNVDSNKFIETISAFDGIFDSASWRYGQIKFIIDDENSFKLHYDNMVSCVDTILPFQKVEDTRADKKPYIFQIPTLHLKALFEEIRKNSNLNIRFSIDENSILVVFSNENININLVKMED